MRFGLSLPHFRQVASPEVIRRVAQRAEHLGYDGIWVSDHIVIPDSAVDRFGSMFYEPLTVLGFAAACTSRVRLGTTVLILPYRNPVVTAKVLATLDVLSGGRVTAGMAVGWTEDEFKALGVPFQERGALSDEYIAAFKALWTQDKPAFRDTTCALNTLPSSRSPCRSRTSRSGLAATASAPFAARLPWAIAGIRRARWWRMSRPAWPICARSAPSVDETHSH